MDMDLDYTALRWWLDVAQLAFTALLGFFVWVTNRDQVRADALQRVEEHTDGRLDDLDKRLTRVETSIEHLPKTEDISRLHDRINAVHSLVGDATASISELNGAVKGIEQTVRLLLEHQVEGRRR